MMGAGPVPIPVPVARANSIVINHLGPTMSRVIDQVKKMARYVFETRSKWILGVAGPGSAAMEMAIVNLVSPGDAVLSVCNGYFSGRLSEMAERCGGEVHRYDVPDNQPADPEALRPLFESVRPKVLTIVQGETSHTLFNCHLPAIAALAKEYECLVIVDAVCTLSTMPLKMDEWGIDAVITGGQKGLSCIPGVSLVAFSETAWQRLSARTDRLSHWCLDARLAEAFWHNSSYHYTAPVSGLLALHEALRLVCVETLEGRLARHRHSSQALQRGIEGMGLALFQQPPHRLNSVVGIVLPDGLSAKKVCTHISSHYKVEISGSFGPPLVRIGQMGEQCRVQHLYRTVHALGSTMKDLGQSIDLPSGMAEMERAIQSPAE